MLFDAQSLFSDAQAVTASAASENVISLGAPSIPKHAAAAITQDIGRGRPIPIVIQVVTAFATLTSLKVGVQTDSTSAFSSAKTVIETAAVPVADLVAGYQFTLDWLPRGVDEAYLRLYYTVAGTNASAGAVTAGLVFGANRGGWSA